MQCPRCQHRNRAQAAFCAECAARLVHTCTRCGAELQPSAKFCDTCGTAAAAVTGHLFLQLGERESGGTCGSRVHDRRSLSAGLANDGVRLDEKRRDSTAVAPNYWLMDRVAKVRIRVSRAGKHHYLMSVKRAEGKRRHGKLELLGGHVEEGEGPLDGLVRELAEEENSGTLSERVRVLAPKATNLHVAGAQHYVFDLEIDQDECEKLEPNPRESLGFELVAESKLRSRDFRSRLTSRTRKILDALDRQKASR